MEPLISIGNENCVYVYGEIYKSGHISIVVCSCIIVIASSIRVNQVSAMHCKMISGNPPIELLLNKQPTHY